MDILHSLDANKVKLYGLLLTCPVLHTHMMEIPSGKSAPDRNRRALGDMRPLSLSR